MINFSLEFLYSHNYVFYFYTLLLSKNFYRKMLLFKFRNVQFQYPDFRPSFDSTRPPPNYPSVSSSQAAVPPSVMSVLAVQPPVPNPFNPMPVPAVLGMHHPAAPHPFILPHPNQFVDSLQVEKPEHLSKD